MFGRRHVLNSIGEGWNDSSEIDKRLLRTIEL